MSLKKKPILFAVLTALAILVTFFVPPVAQPQSFHHFADARRIWGIPNFFNVVTNLPFLVAGAIGMYQAMTVHVRPGVRTTYVVLFLGVLLTGIGSAYYHWQPNNDTLVWDRIPLTVVFMALLSATISEVWSPRLGLRILLPAVAAGIGSVWWWHHTESEGRGDLRPYLLIQFYPVVFIPLLLWLFYQPGLKKSIRALVWVVVWYVIAKVFERFDATIYRISPLSGHSLKHLAAAVSTWYFVVLFRGKYCVQADTEWR